MEKYMFLFRGGDVSNFSPAQHESQMAKWIAWVGKLRQQGKYIAGEPLMPGGKMVSGIKRSVTDGPYAESKEVVGGFFTITAKNYDEAVEIAKECPDFEIGGSVEVRQVLKIEQPA